MLDLSDGEELTQGAVVRVGPSVVAHQPLGGDPLRIEPLKGPCNEVCDGLRSLIAVQFDVGQARVVIDDRVREVIAHPCALIHPVAAAIVVSAKAGPFNLGDVVTRATINVDPHTGAAIVTSDQLPQIIDGVPLRVKTINVTLDRSGFMLNPTSCAQMQITGAVVGALPSGAPGSTVPVSTPYAVAGCKGLPFKPKFMVSTRAKATKKNGASLHVRVKSGPGQANIAKVKVNLPVQLPSRLSTLQKACVDRVFDANPAGCPAASVVGSAMAVTPLLAKPLTGPAYLVSHAGAAFPDLEIVLQGEGITLILDGNTQIKKGITSSIFKAVPDAPISTFDLVLPQGPHSALAAFGSLCTSKLNMPTVITGQNGAVIKQSTKIVAIGCSKHKKAKARHATKRGR
ncbi:MAG TPA: hypothetical protein VFY36_01800 [Solirubrobacteraceae bacterium]|nr:hypothetical protein [Solirubrobacteraceae bacterium]